MFSKSIEYGCMIIEFLKNKKRTTGYDIIEELKIPKYYGLTILKQLSNAGMLNATKGKGGGFILVQENISFLELYEVINNEKWKLLEQSEITGENRYVELKNEIKNKVMETMKELVI